MNPRLMRGFLFFAILGIGASVFVVMRRSEHFWLDASVLFASIFVLLDARSWAAIPRSPGRDRVLDVLQIARVGCVTLALGAHWLAVWNGPTAASWDVLINGALVANIGFACVYAALLHYVPRRDEILLGNMARAWRLGLPKQDVVQQYFWLFIFFAPVDLVLFLGNLTADIAADDLGIVLSLLWFIFVALYAVVGPPFRRLLKPRSPAGDNCFISYARADAEIARSVRESLASSGIACFQDVSRIKGGDNVVNTIGEGIATSDFFVPIISESSVHSRWVRDEILLALHHQELNRSPRVVPVRTCDIDTFEAWVRGGDDIARNIGALHIINLDTSGQLSDEMLGVLARTLLHQAGILEEDRG